MEMIITILCLRGVIDYTAELLKVMALRPSISRTNYFIVNWQQWNNKLTGLPTPTFLELKSTSVWLMTHHGGRWWHTVYQYLAIYNCRDDVRYSVRFSSAVTNSMIITSNARFTPNHEVKIDRVTCDRTTKDLQARDPRTQFVSLST